jgi:hypothetical protein
MTTARHARRRRRRYHQALAHEQRRHRAQARVAPAHRSDDLYAKGIAWTAIVVLVLVALALAASL